LNQIKSKCHFVEGRGFSTDLNLQDVMTSEPNYLDVSVHNVEVMQYRKIEANTTRKINYVKQYTCYK